MASPQEHLMHWLNDAHSMEKQAVESTENQLQRLENYPQLRAWVKDHVDAANRQRDAIRHCIERNGGKPSTAKDAVMTVIAKAHDLAGVFTADEVLKNALDDDSLKAYEVAAYTCIVAAAGDSKTGQVAEDFRDEEQALADRLAELIPSLTREYIERGGAAQKAKR